MRIFDSDRGGWGEKVNFADHNNVMVGYDMGQSCCEHADWFISETEDNNIEDKKQPNEGLEEYVFDKSYFVEVEPAQEGSDTYKYSVLDSGGMVRFKMVAPGKPDLFLHIYNSHNGYYGHGFEFMDGAQEIRVGSL